MAESRAYKRLKKMHPLAHWQRFESWASVGVFDSNACKFGTEVWVENKEVRDVKKRTDDWIVKTKVRNSQIAWESQRRQMNGQTFVAIMIGSDLFVMSGFWLRDLKKGLTYGELKKRCIDPKRLFDTPCYFPYP